MKFKRIFVKKGDCKLWSACYQEDVVNGKDLDIFRKLFNQWNNTAYLMQFFIANEHLLSRPIWGGMQISDAVDKVLDEASDFEMELRNIDTNHPSFKDKNLSDIFENFHSDMYLSKSTNLFHKKAKPNSLTPMIRIYAYEFDNAFIMTGGLIKLTHQLEHEAANKEIEKFERVKQYLASEGYFSRNELDQP
jgi:hypothetical protein